MMLSVVLYDRTTGALSLVGQGEDADISSNGKIVMIFSRFSELALYERETRVTTLVSSAALGTNSGSFTRPFALSADGRFAVFLTGNTAAVYDRISRTTSLANRPGAAPPGGLIGDPAISADGRYVTFASTDPAWVPGPDRCRPVRPVGLGRLPLRSFGGQDHAGEPLACLQGHDRQRRFLLPRDQRQRLPHCLLQRGDEPRGRAQGPQRQLGSLRLGRGRAEQPHGHSPGLRPSLPVARQRKPLPLHERRWPVHRLRERRHQPRRRPGGWQPRDRRLPLRRGDEDDGPGQPDPGLGGHHRHRRLLLSGGQARTAATSPSTAARATWSPEPTRAATSVFSSSTGRPPP